MPDLVFCSHYPFSRQAKEYVSEKGLELTSILLEKAEARVKEAVEQGKMHRVAELQKQWRRSSRSTRLPA